ncbi:MAG: histidinol-phosphate transaminase [Runella slithyformis]|nr:MAG: histidinol-phosphate transaminase [Runella slithyformis]TAF03285.1 MAG: histidinol-phosphate transaminase [Runella slithyformis]TAF29282.1 MAG: histidinol-phosphate transaminase [Runella slithyformis]TAF48299.1 MAG: histidinol-phosphate transaminase [Runella slithyformis]
MSFNLQHIVRSHIFTLTPYSSARDEYTGKEGTFLDANENPYRSVNGQNWNRYPDPYQWEIKQKLAPIKGVRPTQIFLGNGSDEPIDLLIRACCTPRQDSILIMPPTYGMYEVSASINDVPLIKVPLTADFQLDTAAVLAAITPQTKIIWLCSPNNPSGNLLNRADIVKIIENFDGLVVVDEAYIDFADSASFTQQLDKYPNLVVLQTFSKAWGLASLRLGMCFASEEIIDILNKIKPPYNLSGATQAILLEALGYEEAKNKMVQEILAEKTQLQADLNALKLVQHIYPSDANFFLVKFEHAKAIFEWLIAQKIIVRDRSKVTLCYDCLRITVGTAQENRILIEALKNIA